MATRGVSLTVVYVAWDTASNAGKTGDAANHTLRWIKDGTAAAPTNSPVEVDATNAPGAYKLTLTASECDCNIGWLVGKSSTSGVSLMPVKVEFERLPDAAPGAAGGVPTVDANNRIAGIQGIITTFDALSSQIIAPDNESIAAILNTTNKFVFDTSNQVAAYIAPSTVWSHTSRTLTSFGFPVTVGVNNDKTGYTLTPAYDRAKDALVVGEYQAPDNTGIAAIKTQTDKLSFDASNRVITNVAVNQDKTGYSLTTAYDRAKDALKVTEYVTPDNTTIGAISTKADAIKAKTDKLTFNTSNQVEAVVSGIDIDEGALGAAVWEAIRAEHNTPGTTGEALNAVMATAGGSGARTISVTVTDGAAPLEGAKVRFLKGSESYIRATDASGQTTFALDDGTWSWRVTLPGYVGQTGTLVVDGDEALSVALAGVTITPSDPGFTTGYLVCYDETGQPEAGVQVQVQSLMPPANSGIVLDGTIRTNTSNADGIVQFPNLVRGATYQFRRGTQGRWVPVRIPADAPDVLPLPSFVGRP